MDKEEFLKAIMELPKIETDNPISTMNSINVDDLMSAVDRLNKVPDYNDLLKENKKLKEQAEEYKDNYNCLLKQKEQFEYIMSKQVDYRGQQKEFIKYLEDKRDEYAENLEYWSSELISIILSKYKSIIGDVK